MNSGQTNRFLTTQYSICGFHHVLRRKPADHNPAFAVHDANDRYYIAHCHQQFSTILVAENNSFSKTFAQINLIIENKCQAYYPNYVIQITSVQKNFQVSSDYTAVKSRQLLGTFARYIGSTLPQLYAIIRSGYRCWYKEHCVLALLFFSISNKSLIHT